jgi:hypothetical protein
LSKKPPFFRQFLAKIFLNHPNTLTAWLFCNKNDELKTLLVAVWQGWKVCSRVVFFSTSLKCKLQLQSLTFKAKFVWAEKKYWKKMTRVKVG